MTNDRQEPFIITNNKTLHVGYKNMCPLKISEGGFADDVALKAKNQQELQELLYIWQWR